MKQTQAFYFLRRCFGIIVIGIIFFNIIRAVGLFMNLEKGIEYSGWDAILIIIGGFIFFIGGLIVVPLIAGLIIKLCEMLIGLFASFIEWAFNKKIC